MRLDKIKDINTVTTLDTSYMCYGCHSLESVSLPDTLTEIKTNAFYVCDKLATITIPNTVTKIGSVAFRGCDALTHAYYKGSVNEWLNVSVETGNEPLLAALIIGDGSEKPVTETATFGDGLTWTFYTDGELKITGNGAIPDYTSSYQVPWKNRASEVTSISVENGITSIGKNAFSDCSKVTSVFIADSVTNIGTYAFEKCTAITELTMPVSAKIAGAATFKSAGIKTLTLTKGVNGVPDYGSNNYTPWHLSAETLTNVIIEEGVTAIVAGQFTDCMFPCITIPKSLTSIANAAFSGCIRLNDVYYAGTETEWNAIIIGSDNEDISYYPTIHYNS